MQFDPILKQGNELFWIDNLSQGLVSGTYGHPDVLQQSLEFAHDKSPACSHNPRVHCRLEEELVHPRYAAKFVLKRLLAHRCILARPVTRQVRIIGAARRETFSRPSVSKLLPRVVRACQSVAKEEGRQVLKIRKSGSEGALGSRNV